MAGLIPENILEDILSRVDIVEVISGSIPLKRAGRNFKANCPFHHEKTPSFMVSPDRQIYHCFGCGESGNAFKFLMRHERMEFREAVEVLAKKTGVILPKLQQDDPKVVSISTQLYKINELTAIFYQQCLDSAAGSAVKDYLFSRGISQDSIKTFKLGFAPDKWEGLINYLRAKGIGLALLEKAGLIIPKEGGGYYDRFRNRIIFPILDIKARTLAFGARLLPQANDLAKYLNSPETPVYIKGRNLYGLNFAKDAIRQEDCAVVVEGYLDFILPYQEGFQNIVASQGTALTLEQARLLKRYTHNIIMLYDADDAGEAATLRTLDILIEEGMNVRVVCLPQGFDPDLFVRKGGIENFKQKINQAEGLFDYKLKILKSRCDFKEIEGKAGICAQMLPTIKKFSNLILRSEYIKRLAEDLEIQEDALLQELNKVKEDKPYAQPAANTPKKMPAINPTEKLLIKLMLEEDEAIRRIRENLEPADFQHELTSRIVSVMFDLLAQGKKIELSSLVNHLEDDSALEVICESTFMPEFSPAEKEKMLDDCINRLKKERVKAKREYLHQQIKIAQASGDEERLNQLMQEFHRLVKKG